MTTITESGVYTFMGTDSAPNPAPTAAGVRFYAGEFASVSAAQAYLRDHPDTPYQTIDDIFDLNAIEDTGVAGGGNGNTDEYGGGQSDTVTAGTDADGTAYTTTTAPILPAY